MKTEAPEETKRGIGTMLILKWSALLYMYIVQWHSKGHYKILVGSISWPSWTRLTKCSCCEAFYKSSAYFMYEHHQTVPKFSQKI